VFHKIDFSFPEEKRFGNFCNEEGLKMLLKKLGLPENTVSATQHTRLNNRVLKVETQGQIVGGGHWKLGR
jgi:hypothetical protein